MGDRTVVNDIRRLQPDIDLLSAGHRADFEKKNALLHELGEEEWTVAEYLRRRVDEAIEEAERVASQSMLGAYSVEKILAILRGKQ